MQINLIDFDIKGDERGSLISLEEKNNIPFVIKRVYYIFATKLGVIRGLHAHISLRQILICVSGSCKILLDNGKEKCAVDLNQPNQGLLIEKMIWREMYDFSPDCVLMVLANDYYNEKDYIRNYQEFIEFIRRNEKK